MKKLSISILLISIVFTTLSSQNLDLLLAERFQFQEVCYESETGFDDPAIIVNHTGDLSEYDVDFDPEGILSGSLFFYDDEFYYSGSFTGESDVRLFDINLNKNSEHQTILLELSGPCRFVLDEDDNLEFEFPALENMTGIIHFSKKSGIDSFWTSYIIGTPYVDQKLWSVGDLTIITGSDRNANLQYVNPDGTVIDIESYSGFNQYLIAIDESGTYQWSHVIQGAEINMSSGNITQIASRNDEIIAVSNQWLWSNDRICKIFHFDKEGNIIGDVFELIEVTITQLEIDDFDNMMISGIYNKKSGGTNFDFNGGEYFLDAKSVGIANGFFIHYDSDGSVNWCQTVESTTLNYVAGFDCTDDHIYLTGNASNWAIFDINGDNTIQFDTIGGFNVFVSKYLKDGTLEWVNIFESGSASGGEDITVVDDEVLLYGWFDDFFDADPNSSEEMILSESDLPFRPNFFAHLEEKVLSSFDLENHEIIVSPNPASSYLTTLETDSRIITIIDMKGRIVSNYNANRVDVSSFPNGLYIVNTAYKGDILSQLISIIH